MASIGWIDFTKSEKNRVTTVLSMLRPEGRVDELGIGAVRDALADLLFPGLSTVQTRAKYFYIIPNILWAYSKLKPAQKSKKPLARFLQDNEKELMYRLAEHYKFQEGNGVIGISKRRGESLERYPSVIYWNGLNTFKFIQYNDYSLGNYLNAFRKYNIDDDTNYVPTGDDSPADDGDAGFQNTMGIHAPYNSKILEIENLELSEEEAEDFTERIIRCTPDTLLSELISNTELSDLFRNLTYSGRDGFINFAPQAIDSIENTQLKKVIELAHDFSLCMYGAHCTYNQAIQQQLKSDEEFEEDWELWREKLKRGLLNKEALTIDALWKIAPGMKTINYNFIGDWLQLINENKLEGNKRFSLVENHEYLNKKFKARLRNRKLEDCKPGVWLGFDYLDYRFGNARTILNDIITAGN
jgi:hypothetical protein